MAKFNVGDRVIYLDVSGDQDVPNGSLGTIMRNPLYSSSVYIVKFDINKNTLAIHERDIKLAHPYFQQEEAKKLLGLKDV